MFLEAIMYTKHRVFAALAMFAAFGIFPLSAQFRSNTSDATFGLYTTDVDDFLDVNEWQNLEFDKFFSSMRADGSDGIEAGLALKAGSVYLGFGYAGNFWIPPPPLTGTFSSVTTEFGDNFATVNQRGKKTVNYSGNGLQWNSQVFFLLGTASLGGFLLDLNFARAGSNKLDTQAFGPGGNVVTSKDSRGLGAIEAGLSWGKNFARGDYVFKPTLGLAYCFDLGKNVSDTGAGTITTTVLNGIDDFFAGTRYSANGGRVGLIGYMKAHAGLMVDLSKSTGDGSLWIGYNMEQHFYDRQTKDDSGYWEDYSPWLTKHGIQIELSAWYNMDRKLSLGWSVGSGFDLVSASVSTVQTILTNDNEYSELVFEIHPSIAAGVVYKLLPDKFNVNGSLVLFPAGYTYNQFTDNDIPSVIKTSTTAHNIASTAAVTSLGFTWFITDGFAFDACTTTLAIGSRINFTNFSALLSYKR